MRHGARGPQVFGVHCGQETVRDGGCGARVVGRGRVAAKTATKNEDVVTHENTCQPRNSDSALAEVWGKCFLLASELLYVTAS